MLYHAKHLTFFEFNVIKPFYFFLNTAMNLDLPNEFFFIYLCWLFFYFKIVLKTYFFKSIFEHPWNMFIQLDDPVVI